MSPESADTSPETTAMWHRLLMARSGEERLAMATGMFGTAKQLVFARLRDRGIHDAVDLKMAALEQLYGDELTESQRAEIRARLVSRAAVAARG
jgi:hypothetical protein